MGVMRKAYEEGIQIPSDLSVIGFDDIRLAQFVLPALTTVQMSQAELARLAFNALLTELQRETPSPTGTEYVLENPTSACGNLRGLSPAMPKPLRARSKRDNNLSN